ncbi:MAG: DUF429 domain-containing protein [Gammaproteobacteria bacterium]|nr:DUF429 domain-containing protein [Gammaproteobacteria bacterium]
MNKQSAYVGVDVACAVGKHLPISIVIRELNQISPLPLRQLPFAPPKGCGNVGVIEDKHTQVFAQEAREYVVRACQHVGLIPARIGIDAPLRPRIASITRRHAEAALDRKGISAFTTPSRADFEQIQIKVRAHLAQGGRPDRLPHGHQLWMLAGFAIADCLSVVAPCIEVYPQATIRVLGGGARHKTRSGAVAEQLSLVAHQTGFPRTEDDWQLFYQIAHGPAHDRLDAYISAWVASLDEHERIGFGTVPDDVIWVPRITSAASSAPSPPSSMTRPVKPAGTTGGDHAMTCPACSHEFKRWPFGWDAHAAYRCPGLPQSLTPEERKAIYRQRYSQYFK